MALTLPRFSNWKTLAKTPTQRKISGNTNKFRWTDLFKPIGDVLGFAFGGLKSFFSWSMTAVIQLITTSFRFSWNFNWNIPDEDLMASLENQRLAWYAQYGSVVGQGLGWVICGIIPSATVMYFNKPLGLQILNDVGEEAYEELVGELGILLQMSARTKLTEWLVQAFISFRHTIKGAANGQANPLVQGLADKFFDVFPGTREAAKHWGDKGGKPWILADKVEEWIENPPLEQEWKIFLEEAIEEFGDACNEALLCFAGSFDNHVAQQALDNQIQNEPNTIVITPNRKAPEEKIILYGTTEELKPAITQTIAHYQLIDNKNIGYDLGMPLIERAHKQISEYVIVLFLKSVKEPPYGRGAKQHQIRLNSANKLKFTDFDKVIKALGGGGEEGNVGYMYGNFFGRAQMSDGSTLELWCDNNANVKLRIEAIAELTEAEIQTLNITEEIKDYQRTKVDSLAKDIYRVYPWKMEVIRKTKVYQDYNLSNDTIPGRPNRTKQGYYKNTPPYTLQLWQGYKPANWDEVMVNLTAPIPSV